MPWPETCARCAWIRPLMPFTDAIARRHLRKLQIEPSLVCNLKCPACSNQMQIRQRPRPFQMGPNSFADLLASLAGEGFAIDEIEYCGQGEPLLHPQFSRFLAAGREYFPSALQRVITNGNVEYSRAIGEAASDAPDEIFVSCDGVHQASYEQYRIRGDVDRAMRFMADAAGVPNRTNRVIWKYILFEFNDTLEELEEAQQKAVEIGVDRILFVVTHSAARSQRWTEATLYELPRYVPIACTNATPVHYRETLTLTPLGGWSMRPRYARQHLLDVEEVVYRGANLDIKGWAAASVAGQSIDIYLDGLRVGALIVSATAPGSHPRQAAEDRGTTFTESVSVSKTTLSAGEHYLELCFKSRGRRVRMSRAYHLQDRSSK